MNINTVSYPVYSGQISAPASSKPAAPQGQPDQDRQSSPEKTQQPEEKNNSAVSTQAQALSQEEVRLVEELKKIDTKVRQHEMAHIAAGGRYITSGANFTFKRGPDGKNYAVAGEVSIDTSPVPGDPEATIDKMRRIKNAALAPADPSTQDLKVASNATSQSSKAMAELMQLTARQQAEENQSKAFGNMRNASDSYIKVNSLPEYDNSSFKIAV